jgi:hypothetical protein
VLPTPALPKATVPGAARAADSTAASDGNFESAGTTTRNGKNVIVEIAS